MSSADSQPIERFGKNSCASAVVVCGRPGGARRKFWCFATRALRRRFDHAAVHGYFAFTRMNEVGSRFSLHERGVRQQFTIKSDAGIRLGARSRAMQDMQLIGAIDFRLRLLERDRPA